MQCKRRRFGEAKIDVGLLLPPVQTEGIQLDELWREGWLVAMPTGHRLAGVERRSRSATWRVKASSPRAPNLVLDVTPKVSRCSWQQAFSRASLRALSDG